MRKVEDKDEYKDEGRWFGGMERLNMKERLLLLFIIYGFILGGSVVVFFFRWVMDVVF